MRKFITAVAAAACLGSLISFSAFAAEQLPTPTGLKWSDTKKGEALFNPVQEAEGEYDVIFYKDGEEFDEQHWTGNTQGSISEYYFIEESGTYTFKVRAKGDDINNIDSDFSALSPELVYTLPEDALGEVENLRWENATTAAWDKLTDSKYGNYIRYQVSLFRDGEICYMIWGTPKTSLDLGKHMQEEGDYTFSVKAVSNDIDKVTHGPLVTFDGSYDASEENAELSEKLDEIGDIATASNAISALSKLDKNKLQVAMQTDPDILNQIERLENTFGSSVEKNVADDVGMSADEIDVIGAGLSYASASNAVKFNVKKPDKEAKVDKTLYKNTVQFDISLSNAKSVLTVPITIRMPIPEGIKPIRLTILHYHKDGSYEAIYPKIDGDYAIFTVKSFSTFVFAERTEKENNNDSSGNSGNSGSSGRAGVHGVDRSKYAGTAAAGTPGWNKAASDWLYLKDNGQYASNEWLMIHNQWYYFNADSKMTVGWVLDKTCNKWFYCLPDGSMATGWQNINGKWYYLNPVSDGSRGALVTNSVVDGFQVDENGVRQ